MPDGHGVGVEGGLAAGPDLLVDVGRRLGGVHGQLDADRLGVELARPRLGHVLAAVHLLVILGVLKRKAKRRIECLGDCHA